MQGPTYDQSDGSPKIDPQIKTFDAASALWVIVVGAVGFLVLVRRGLRPSASAAVAVTT